MTRFVITLLALFTFALQLTADDKASGQQREHLTRLGVGLLTLQSATPLAPLRLQQLNQVLSQMPLGARSFSE